jgi:hypothetical protein
LKIVFVTIAHYAAAESAEAAEAGDAATTQK